MTIAVGLLLGAGLVLGISPWLWPRAAASAGRRRAGALEGLRVRLRQAGTPAGLGRGVHRRERAARCGGARPGHHRHARARPRRAGRTGGRDAAPRPAHRPSPRAAPRPARRLARSRRPPGVRAARRTPARRERRGPRRGRRARDHGMPSSSSSARCGRQERCRPRWTRSRIGSPTPWPTASSRH